MSIFSAIGLFWVVLTSTLATIAIFYLAFRGLRKTVRLIDSEADMLIGKRMESL